MKYMLLIYQQEVRLTDDVREACYAESGKVIDDARSKGQFIAAEPLYPTTEAHSVRVREGTRFVTDGPFAETHEQLGGYYIVDVDNVDQAIEIAAKIPGARYGTVEVRRIIDLDSSSGGRK